jgi:hypothetical protein
MAFQLAVLATWFQVVNVAAEAEVGKKRVRMRARTVAAERVRCPFSPKLMLLG